MSQFWPLPAEITGQVKANGAWGGTRLYGSAQGTSQHYCWISNNTYNDESAKIFYTVRNNWVTFKLILKDGNASLYINDTLFKSVACDTTGDVRVYAGSNVNPVSLNDVKIKAL